MPDGVRVCSTRDMPQKKSRFFVGIQVANASSPLNETSVSCAQGVFGDDTWACESKAISHRVSTDRCIGCQFQMIFNRIAV